MRSSPPPRPGCLSSPSPLTLRLAAGARPPQTPEFSFPYPSAPLHMAFSVPGPLPFPCQSAGENPHTSPKTVHSTPATLPKWFPHWTGTFCHSPSPKVSSTMLLSWHLASSAIILHIYLLMPSVSSQLECKLHNSNLLCPSTQPSEWKIIKAQ